LPAAKGHRGNTPIGQTPPVKPRAEPPDEASPHHHMANHHGVSHPAITSAPPENIAVLKFLDIRGKFILLIPSDD
jgi:hypothetical protein